MDFDVTREQWVARFAMKMGRLDVDADPSTFASLAESLWPSLGQREPESAADEAYTTRFERTERLPVQRGEADAEYVRDTGEWIARCVARVLALDPIIKSEEAHRSVSELAELDRWRLMTPEAAAEQLYTPIRPR